MITLYTFGPYYGPTTPMPAPSSSKVMLLLKFAGLPYREDRNGLAKAPKGKLPYIDDDGEIVADPTFIRFHIEKKYRLRFRCRAFAGTESDRLGGREDVRRSSLFRLRA